MLVLKLLG